MTPTPTPTAAFAPLRHPAFRALWIANLASNTGLWIQNTGAGWPMTSLAPSPVMVSLVQAATMLPVFLFALPGGALADILDRRLTLIAAQIWIAVAGLLLAALAAVGLLGAWGLLALTFAIGAGTAVIFPAWAAATPELVPRDDLLQAVALNGVGFNLARALGRMSSAPSRSVSREAPALGGFAMATAGPAATFSLNALGFLALLWALLVWRRPAPPRSDASLLAYAAMALLGAARHWVPAALAVLLFGAAWLAAGTTLGAAAQMTAPAWARARALGVYHLSFFGALAIGSAVWGWVGTRLNVSFALAIGAATGAIAAAAVQPWRISALALGTAKS
jgi:MFS family permease